MLTSLSAVRPPLLSAAIVRAVGLHGPPLFPVGTAVFTIGGPATSHVVAPGFLGLSLEYWPIPDYAGSDPFAIDPVFVQLIRHLAGGYPPVLRIGGYTTDISWWPAPGLRRPAGVSYAVTRRWIAVTRALVMRLSARLIVGINLEAGQSRHRLPGGEGAAGRRRPPAGRAVRARQRA
jgi:hypothetical protein